MKMLLIEIPELRAQVVEALAQWVELNQLSLRQAADALGIEPPLAWSILTRAKQIRLEITLNLWKHIGGTFELTLTPPAPESDIRMLLDARENAPPP